MKKSFAFFALVTLSAILLGSAAPSFAYTNLFSNYSGRNGVTVGSDTLPATLGQGGNLLWHNYKTAVCFGNMSGTNDKVTVQGSHDGTNWFDCKDDAGNTVSWTKATLGTVKKWWDTFYAHRATYLKNYLSGRTVTVQVNSQPGSK